MLRFDSYQRIANSKKKCQNSMINLNSSGSTATISRIPSSTTASSSTTPASTALSTGSSPAPSGVSTSTTICQCCQTWAGKYTVKNLSRKETFMRKQPFKPGEGLEKWLLVSTFDCTIWFHTAVSSGVSTPTTICKCCQTWKGM